ncbi:riboflavin kinase-like [Vombatus ursinus]|uniref:Riboflavin kinase n=2 Tax=Vombatus ursinus TaxID=29139 RepID=A0A4X2JLW3_VOMUR|nr:riboflavin kinase-like [Vombatus ursinus]XP_027705536.1 riboflavin kinase-like [Vombatus ursinus]
MPPAQWERAFWLFLPPLPALRFFSALLLHRFPLQPASGSACGLCWVSGARRFCRAPFACSVRVGVAGREARAADARLLTRTSRACRVLPPSLSAFPPPLTPGGPGGTVALSSTAAPPDSSPGPSAEPRAGGVMKHLPYFCRGKVVRGFGRGSKQLGIPTANFPEQVVDNLPCDLSTGIYYGWACVGNGDVHKMVLSIGWNPYYKNTKKSVETHIIHTFEEDFYGEILSIVITGYIRPEKNFSSIDALISAIQDDIEEAKRQLDLPEHLKLKEDNFFHMPESQVMNGH